MVAEKCTPDTYPEVPLSAGNVGAVNRGTRGSEIHFLTCTPNIVGALNGLLDRAINVLPLPPCIAFMAEVTAANGGANVWLGHPLTGGITGECEINTISIAGVQGVLPEIVDRLHARGRRQFGTVRPLLAFLSDEAVTLEFRPHLGYEYFCLGIGDAGGLDQPHEREQPVALAVLLLSV